MVSVFGGLAALAGMEHGIGEALQGSVAPAGLVFPSWPDAAFFRSVAGEPAMSLVPNLLASGILSILVSLVFLVWAIAFPHRKRMRPGPAGSCRVVLLLVGGGFGPPLLGTRRRHHRPEGALAPERWRRAFRKDWRRALGPLWPWILAAAIPPGCC